MDKPAEQQSRDSRWEQLNEVCKVFVGISAQAKLLGERLSDNVKGDYYDEATFVLAIQTMAQHGHNLAEQAMPEAIDESANGGDRG